jgi:hypothetical protein
MPKIKHVFRVPVPVYRSVAAHWGWHSGLKDENGAPITRRAFMDNKIKEIYIKAHESNRSKISAENAIINAAAQARTEGEDGITITSEEEA